MKPAIPQVARRWFEPPAPFPLLTSLFSLNMTAATLQLEVIRSVRLDFKG